MHVVITGANRGIGAQIAADLRAQGHRVTTIARQGCDVTLDLSRPDDFQNLSDAIGAAPIDLLVCNAGVYLDKGHSLDNGYSAALWDQTFAVNVTGVFLTIQSLLPNLRAAKGKIAIISSQMASQSKAPGRSYIYRASKAAALNLGRNLADDLKTDGIAVGIYHPGWVQTDMGGSAADIDVQTSAAGLIDRFKALSLDTTGCFQTWDGHDHPL